MKALKTLQKQCPAYLGLGEKLEELRVLKELSRESAVAALCLAFDYGRAKGWQAARAEEKNSIKYGTVL